MPSAISSSVLLRARSTIRCGTSPNVSQNDFEAHDVAVGPLVWSALWNCGFGSAGALTGLRFFVGADRGAEGFRLVFICFRLVVLVVVWLLDKPPRLPRGCCCVWLVRGCGAPAPVACVPVIARTRAVASGYRAVSARSPRNCPPGPWAWAAPCALRPAPLLPLALAGGRLADSR